MRRRFLRALPAMPEATHHAATPYADRSAMVPNSATGEKGVVDAFTVGSLERRRVGQLLVDLRAVVLRRALRHQIGRVDDIGHVRLDRDPQAAGEGLHL